MRSAARAWTQFQELSSATLPIDVTNPALVPMAPGGAALAR
jgi:hypothetical protein